MSGEPKDYTAQRWIDLSLFYARTPRMNGDPPTVEHRGVVLYGEGRFQTDKPNRPKSVEKENLGGGIFVIRVMGREKEIVEQLLKSAFDYRLDKEGNKHDRITFGFVQRPPVLGLPGPTTGILRSPARTDNHVCYLHQFVSTDKNALLMALAGQEKPDSQSRKRVGQLLAHLDWLLQSNFQGEDNRFFADVLLVEPATKRPIVSWEPISEEDSKAPCQAAEFTVDTTQVTSDLYLNIRIFGTDRTVIDDRMRVWRLGEPEKFRVVVEQRIQSIHVRGWLNERLVADDHEPILREISLSISLQGGALTYMDRLAQRLQGVQSGDAALMHKITDVQKPVIVNTSILGSSNEPWDVRMTTATTIIDHARLEPSPHEYFPADPEGRARAILAFAEMLSKAKMAWIVDPFFDAQGAEALLPRIKADNLQLIVITNLPDDSSERTKLLDWLQNARLLLPPRLEIHRVRRLGSAQQDFHDRWVITVQSNGEINGYVLTNSFSGMASRYPLIVTEVNAPLTSQLLAETESILDRNPITTRTEKLWPETISPPQQYVSDGRFYGWQYVVSRCVPRCHRTESEWLRAAAELGFLHLRSENRIQWRTTSVKHREILLKRVLGKWHFSPRKRLGHLIHRNKFFGHRGVPMLGWCIMLLGEMHASGFEITPKEVATRLRPGDAYALEKCLRRTFCLPNAGILNKNTTLQEIGIRQAMEAKIPTYQLVELGFALRDGGWLDLPMSPNVFGRKFVYAVLLHLAPYPAVRLAEELLDPVLLNCVADRLHAVIGAWTNRFSEAFLKARSPALRALGAQSLVPNIEARDNRGRMFAPKDPRPILDKVTELGIPSLERAMYIAVWGAQRSQPDTRGDLASVLVELLNSESEAEIDACAAYMFGAPKSEFLEQVVQKAMVLHTEGSARMLSGIVKVFAKRLQLPEGKGELPSLYFNSKSDLPITAIISQAIAELSKRGKTSCQSFIESTFQRKSLDRERQPLSPMRWRRNYDGVMLRLGWIWLIELMATAHLSSVGDPQDAMTGARNFLDQSPHGDPVLRDLMNEIQNRLNAAFPPRHAEGIVA